MSASRRPLLALLGVTSVAGLTIFTVHWQQKEEREVRCMSSACLDSLCKHFATYNLAGVQRMRAGLVRDEAMYQQKLKERSSENPGQ